MSVVHELAGGGAAAALAAAARPASAASAAPAAPLAHAQPASRTVPAALAGLQQPSSRRAAAAESSAAAASAAAASLEPFAAFTASGRQPGLNDLSNHVFAASRDSFELARSLLCHTAVTGSGHYRTLFPSLTPALFLHDAKDLARLWEWLGFDPQPPGAASAGRAPVGNKQLLLRALVLFIEESHNGKAQLLLELAGGQPDARLQRQPYDLLPIESAAAAPAAHSEALHMQLDDEESGAENAPTQPLLALPLRLSSAAVPLARVALQQMQQMQTQIDAAAVAAHTPPAARIRKSSRAPLSSMSISAELAHAAAAAAALKSPRAAAKRLAFSGSAEDAQAQFALLPSADAGPAPRSSGKHAHSKNNKHSAQRARSVSPSSSDSSSTAESSDSADSSSDGEGARERKRKRAAKKKQQRKAKKKDKKKHRRRSPSPSSSDSSSSSSASASSDSSAGTHPHSLRKEALNRPIARATWRRLAPSGQPRSFLHWVERVAQWKSTRNSREAASLAHALDELICPSNSARRASFTRSRGLEILVRRLVAVHTADTYGSWDVSQAIELNGRTVSLLPDAQVQRVLKSTNSTRALTKGVAPAGGRTAASQQRSGNNNYGGGKQRRQQPASSGRSRLRAGGQQPSVFAHTTASTFDRADQRPRSASAGGAHRPSSRQPSTTGGGRV